jgi:hypothetical protein
MTAGFLTPLAESGYTRERICVAVFLAEIGKHFAGELDALSAMAELFLFTAALYFTDAAPKGLFHVCTALAVDFFSSITGAAPDSAARFVHKAGSFLVLLRK